MLCASSALLVLRRGTYSDAADRDPIRWHSGELVQFVELYDAEDGGTFTATLDEALNAAGPQPLTEIAATFSVSIEDRAIVTRSGRDGSVKRFKWRLIDTKPMLNGKVEETGQKAAA